MFYQKIRRQNNFICYICMLQGEITRRWIGVLCHFSTVLGYTVIMIRLSVSTARGTECFWEWNSNLLPATENYLSWDSNPNHSGERRVVSKWDAFTNRPRWPLWYKDLNLYYATECVGNCIYIFVLFFYKFVYWLWNIYFKLHVYYLLNEL